MTTVTVDFRLINSGGHHRQPRTGPTWTSLPGGYLNDSTPGSTAQATAHVVPDASFLFWSASDGAGGQATQNPTVNQPVGTNPLHLTAWYLPTGGIPGVGGTGVLLDAFSLNLGDFVDDDFVTVTSDTSLTSEANISGVVPTTVAETLQAFGTVHGGQFVEWIGTGATTSPTLSLGAGVDGFSIATYASKKVDTTIPPVTIKEGWLIFGGIASDGDGFVIPIGGGHGGGPVGPWGPFVANVARLLNVSVSAGTMGKEGVAVQRAALTKLGELTKTQLSQVGRIGGVIIGREAKAAGTAKAAKPAKPAKPTKGKRGKR